MHAWRRGPKYIDSQDGARIVGRVPEVIRCPRRLVGDPSAPLPLRRNCPPRWRDRTSMHCEGSIMNWSNIETGWNDFKANAKQQWSKLSDQQISDTLGKREQLSASVQQAYALSKEETERQVSDWQSKQVEKKTASGNS